jgi:hypothetical protein
MRPRPSKTIRPPLIRIMSTPAAIEHCDECFWREPWLRVHITPQGRFLCDQCFQDYKSFQAERQGPQMWLPGRNVDHLPGWNNSSGTGQESDHKIGSQNWVG